MPANSPKIIAIIGARPQFIKHSAFIRAACGHLEVQTLYSGQHHSSDMSLHFLEEFNMPAPHYSLDLLSTTRAGRTLEMEQGISNVLANENPSWVLVYGDTDTTLAGARAAAALNIPLAHVEAGVRSFNAEMPEEYNRIETDKLSALHFCPNEKAAENLRNEGHTGSIEVVGDIMKDVLKHAKTSIGARPFPKPYIYVSLHRPYNVDQKERLEYILKALNELPLEIRFTLHPRTAQRVHELSMDTSAYSNIHFIQPQAYHQNLTNMHHSECIITDSGGMQKEAYWLEKKCITLRSETEWPETLAGNANNLVFNDLEKMGQLLDKSEMSFDVHLYGDGKAGEKMVEKLLLMMNVE